MHFLPTRNKIFRFIMIISFGIIASTSVMAEVYISDDFESGNLSKWYVYKNDLYTRTPDVVKNIGGNSTSVMHLPYFIAAGGHEHTANGQYIGKGLGSRQLDHVFISGRFYAAPTNEPTYGRKLMYIKSEPWTDPRWDLIIGLTGLPSSYMCITVGSNYHNYSTLAVPEEHVACDKIHYGEWHSIEIELKLNSVGNKDGLVRLWLDGNLELERTGLTFRIDNKPLGWVEIGRQIDRNGDLLERQEDRYWDDITISSTYVGMGERSSSNVGVEAPPAPPSNIQ